MEAVTAGTLGTALPNSVPPMIASLVSTIIPVYNRPRQLREAVESVIKQDYRPIEIIIVDDGSTDDETPEAARSLAHAHPDVVRVVDQTNGGPGAARENGRQHARGEFIQYLDSDDILLPGKFSAQVAALRATPGADVAYGITFFRDHAGRPNPEPHKDTGCAKATMFPSFLISRWWETATPLYRTSVCEEAGPWTNLRLEEDWEYDCRIASLGGRLVYCAVPVSEHRDHDGGRLSRGDSHDPVRLRMRAISHGLVWGHAVRAGLCKTAPIEVGRFSRSLFLLARQCGAAKLASESQQLHALALEAAAEGRGPMMGLRIYSVTAKLIGWKRVGALSDFLDRSRGLSRRMLFGSKARPLVIEEDNRH